MVRYSFPPMLILTRVIMNRLQEPQKEMISSRLNVRKVQASIRTFHSSATRLWNETELSLRDISSQNRFLRDLQRKMILKNSAAEHFNINYMYYFFLKQFRFH